MFNTSLFTRFATPATAHTLPSIDKALATNPDTPLTLLMKDGLQPSFTRPEFGSNVDSTAHTKDGDAAGGDKKD
jgi:hypothetical protein